MSLLIKAIKYFGALYLPGRHLFKVSRWLQHTVFSISLTEFPFKINSLRALQNKGCLLYTSDAADDSACVEVSSLPKGVLVEIDCVAFID